MPYSINSFKVMPIDLNDSPEVCVSTAFSNSFLKSILKSSMENVLEFINLSITNNKEVFPQLFLPTIKDKSSSKSMEKSFNNL